MLRPTAETPLLYDSPHSGREYPADFRSRATHVELRRGEDAYVDELLAPSVAHGATLIVNDGNGRYFEPAAGRRLLVGVRAQFI